MDYLFYAILIMILKASSMRKVAMANLVSSIWSSNLEMVSASLSESAYYLSVIFPNASQIQTNLLITQKKTSIIIILSSIGLKIHQPMTIINLIGIVINPHFTKINFTLSYVRIKRIGE